MLMLSGCLWGPHERESHVLMTHRYSKARKTEVDWLWASLVVVCGIPGAWIGWYWQIYLLARSAISAWRSSPPPPRPRSPVHCTATTPACCLFQLGSHRQIVFS